MWFLKTLSTVFETFSGFTLSSINLLFQSQDPIQDTALNSVVLCPSFLWAVTVSQTSLVFCGSYCFEGYWP